MLPMENKLLDLYGRLAKASARSKLFAMRARKDGKPALAKLFLAMADSQSMQAQRFLVQVRGTLAATDENKQVVIDAELPAAIAKYEELLAEAEQMGSKALTTGFRHSGNVDKILLSLFKNLKDEDIDTEYFVCDFCGFVIKNAPPEKCPICTAPKRRFKKVGVE